MTKAAVERRPGKLPLEAGLRRLVVAMALALSAAGCARHIGQTELSDRLAEGTAPPIIDVRSKGEYAAAHVPGAVHVPFYSILADSSELPEPHAEGDPIVVYCEHGPRAGIARAQLWFVSNHPILFLEGHMSAWKRNGLPVEAVNGSGESEGNR